MAEKNLTESAWKAFAKGKSYKDSAFLKALAALDKAKTADEMSSALDDVDKESSALAKANKGDKALADYIDDVEKAIARQRKEVKTLAKQEQEAAESEDDEADTPVLLTTKMIPLIRQVKKGDVMNVLLATAGKQTAVLMMRKAIAPSRRKLLAEYMGLSGGIKYIKGQVGLGEGNTILFDLETGGGGGMAKRIRQALLDQTGQRLKLKCRAADTGEEDEDGEDEGDAGNEIPQAPPLPQGKGETGDDADEEEDEDKKYPLKVPYEKRMAELEPQVLAALKAQQGDVGKIRAVSAFAAGKAQERNYEAAMKSLDMLEKLLGHEPPAVDPATAFNARLAALMPKVKEAVAAAGPAATDIKLKVSEGGVFARKREFERAHALLDEAEKLMQSASATPEDKRQAEVDALLERLTPDYERVAGASLNPEQSAQFKAVGLAWDMAQESLEGGNLDRALTILKRLADGGALARLVASLEAPTGQGGGDPGRLVKQRQFLLQRWARIPGELRTELQSLRKSVRETAADDDPDGLVDAIESALDDLLSEMQDMIDDAINVGDTKGIEGARRRVQSDPLVQHLRASPGFDGNRLLAAIIDAVGEVEEQMTAA